MSWDLSGKKQQARGGSQRMAQQMQSSRSGNKKRDGRVVQDLRLRQVGSCKNNNNNNCNS